MSAGRQAPLSFSQERFWFMERLIEGIPLHHYPFAFRIEGNLDVDALEGSIREIVRRHEILRTRFPESPPTAVQEVLDDRRLTLERTVIHPGPEAEAETGDWMRDFSTRRFDLATEPGFRVGLATLGPGRYVLLFVHHHIAFDGWSRGVIAKEIGRLYAALRRGEEADLPRLPLQYADYAIWQRERMAGDHGREGRKFWVAELTGVPTDLDLPADRPRQPKPSYRGDRRYSWVAQETRAALDALAGGERATPFMAFLAAFQVLVHRYTGLKDFLIGIPVAGRRDHPGVDSLVGPFVNTIVLRADLSGDPGFRALLRRVRETALRSLPRQEHPFEDVVEAIGPERSLSRNPLFQVMLNYRSYPGRPFELEGLECEEIRAGAGMSEVDLMLAALAWRPGPLELEWVYASDRFDASTIERMAAHFERLVGAIVSDPDRPVEELPLLSEEERRTLLRWGRSDEPAVGDSIVSRIEASARRDPDRPAIVLGERRLTYGELGERSLRVASALRARGKGPGSVVGICLDRSPELFVSIAGVLTSGAAYLPLDPSSPDDRMRYLIEHAEVDLVLSDEGLASRVREMGPEVVSWDVRREEPPARESAPPADDEDLAYVIYTSGSTGRPKGVEIQRRSVANFTDWAVREMGLSAADRVLQFCSIGFDVSIMEFLPTLTTGATLVLREPGPPPSPSGFGRWLEEHAISVAILPTAYWHGWAAHVARAGSSAVPASLRLVAAVGEKALSAPYAAWRAAAPRSVRWINGYGPTEATILATAFEPDQGKVWSPAEDIPIGSPIAGSRAYVLDDRMQPVPVGVPGEIGLGGPGIAIGYRNDPERTAERFFDDPFRPGGRLYRTGDRGRWRPDGRLEFLGRVDDQLKIRGYRVEPAEVEAHLADHPGVATEAVVAREVGGSRVLVAYVTPVTGRRLEAAEIREWLTGRLPDYMVPGIVEVLEEMPLTASGKVDRVALPAPSHARARGAYLAPRTTIEHALVGIWQRLLAVARVGIRDDFFDLGGHSLIALQVIAEAERVLERSVPLSLVFECPTIEDLAAAIEGQPVA